MIGRNRVELIGYVGQDPEYFTDTPSHRATFSVATSESYLKKNGEPVEVTSWHACTSWNMVADRVARFVKRGSLVMVEGKLDYWEHEKEGFGKVKRVSIKVDSFIVLKEGKGLTATQEERVVQPAPVSEDDEFKNKGQVVQTPSPIFDNTLEFPDTCDDLPF